METTIVTLRSVRLDAPLDDSGPALVLVELLLPRPGIQSRTALKTVDLARGKRSLARAAFHEAALLKERVEGPFGLKVALTRPQAHPEIAGLLQGLLATGIEGAGGWLAGGSLAALRPLIREPFEDLADRIGDEAPDFIATGGVDLEADGGGSLVRIPLRLARNLREADLPPGPKSRQGRKTKATRYRKGRVVGELVVNLAA